MLTRGEIRPGMKIRNKRSGRVGIAKAEKENPEKLRFCSLYHLVVETTALSGKHKGEKEEVVWYLENLEIINE